MPITTSGPAPTVDLTTVAQASNYTSTRAGYLDNLSGGTPETAIGTTATDNTYVQLLASSAAAITGMTLSGSVSVPSNTDDYVVYLATGGGGSEVVRGVFQTTMTTPTISDPTFRTFVITVKISLPVGTRVAMKFDSVGGAATCQLRAGLTVEERV